MALLPETREALARYDAWLARTVKSPEAMKARARRIERKTRAVGRRIRNMLLGAFAVVLAAVVYGGFIGPLGFGGVMLTILAAFVIMAVLTSWPRERSPTLEALPEVPLKALPAQVEDWLEGHRALLPAPVTAEIDRIMTRLDLITPQLAKLDAGHPMADDARRLIGDHLPRLVKSYAEVPATHRATPEATRHLKEGLKVVAAEIDRINGSIARESLTALEVEGRFLENRYQPEKPGKP